MRGYVATAFFFLFSGIITGYHLGSADVYRNTTLTTVLDAAEKRGIKIPPGSRMKSQTTKYSNAAYGFSFDYMEGQDGYVLVPNEIPPESDQKILSITLFKKSEYAELRSNSIAREGPPTIAIEVFKNPQEIPARSWIESSSFSNFKLIKGEPHITLIGAIDAIGYEWSGLYESESVVFTHGNHILVFSVGYLSPQDDIRNDFELILRSLLLTNTQ